MSCKWKSSMALAAMISSFLAPAALAQGDISASIKIDHRGLIEIPGILRSFSGASWGAANLVVFGPSWGYSAQDYALKNVKKTGEGNNVAVTGDLQVPGTKVQVSQVMKSVKTADGNSALHVTWTLNAGEPGKPLNLQNAYVSFPLAIADFSESTVLGNKGAKAVLPATYSTEYIDFPRDVSEVTVKGRTATFSLKGNNLNLVVVDGRKEKGDCYQLRIEFQNTKDASSSTIEFEVSGSFPPFSLQADKDWVPFPHSNAVEPGSILDFSSIHGSDAPAGKYGHIITGEDGHYVFEKDPAKRVRLVGANLCFTANFVEKSVADQIAVTFKRMGYNTVRFHHTDVMMMKGDWDSWNAGKQAVIDPAKLDKLDYLFAAMKKAGMYVTFDLYAMGCYGRIEGVEKPVYGEMKALVPIHQPAFDAWAKNALEWMNHVNPYTGIAWKDDPAIVAICPLNEDSIVSVWGGAKDKYEAKFADWKKGKESTGRTDKQLLAQFLTELKVESNKKIEKFLRDNGVRPLLSGSNWWDTQAQAFERDSLDVVDNHQYADHPDNFRLPSRYNQKSTLKEGNPTYMVPIMKTPSRIFGKPFVITEYNYCAPNLYRAEGGAMMGAYAALQDWDGLYRFAWAHDSKYLQEQCPISGFDISTDPLNQLTERQILLLFGRGDVAPATQKFVYAVTMNEASEKGPGDMWGNGLFPHSFNAMALVSKIGSQVVEGGRAVTGKFDGVVAAKAPAEAALAGNKFIATTDLPNVKDRQEVVSDTGEIAINNKQGYLRVMAPKSACIVAPAGINLTAGGLSIANSDTFSSVSASSMDDKPISDSSRVLIFHLTNVLNTDMAFSNDKMNMLFRTGKLPYLAKTGSVDVTLKNSNSNLKLYAIASNGKRIGAVPAAYANGAYTFKATILASDKNPTMIYELAK